MTLSDRRPRLFAVPLLAFALLLGGCSTAPADVETPPTAAAPAPEVTPSAVPAPTQEPETGETQPAAVFDADCDAALSADDLSDELGEEVTLVDRSGLYELSQAGGVNCLWRTDSYSTLVSFNFLPQTSIKSTAETAECSTDTANGDVWRCEIEHQKNGIRMSGFYAVPPSVSKKKATSALDSIIELFDERATPDEAAPTPIPAADAWPNPVDCTALGDAVDLAPVFNNTPGFAQQAAGNDADPSPVLKELWGETSGLACYWSAKSQLSEKQLQSGMAQGFAVTVLGGAAWARAEIEQMGGATEVDVDGLGTVIRTREKTSSELVYTYSVIDGPNLLQFSSPNKKAGSGGKAAALVVAYLDTL